jgi:hypothetical protein
MKKILLQTTITPAKDDWSISRFCMLADFLSELTDSRGAALYQVVARDRQNDPAGDDVVLSKLDDSEFDQLWLFGVDVGGGLTANDCAAISRFRQRGGGILTSRDHEDLGISFCTIGGIGNAHHFHSKNPEPDTSRHKVDDTETPTISWPNYHSGHNGDYQTVEAVGSIHPVMRNPKNPSGKISLLPAHPHEGAISVPKGTKARVIATGRSQLTGRGFNLAVAFERDGSAGRAVADSSFHHFLDYNLDPARGCPSFVTEPPGDGMLKNAAARNDTFAYFQNLAAWLSE